MLTFQRIHLCPIDETELSSSFEIRISDRLFKKWRLTFHQSLTLHCGGEQVSVECMPLEQEGDFVVQCSHTTFQALRLPEGVLPLHIAYDKQSNQLYLGPIMAVLTVEKAGSDQRFGNITDYCIELCQYAKTNHIFCYVLTIPNWSVAGPTGYTHEKKDWTDKPVPIPDVVYNRIGSRRLENSSFVQSIFEEFRQLEIGMFNDRFLGKWDVYEALNRYEEIKPHLPDTIRLENESSLATMLEDYNLLFLKPENGSQGKGIFQLQEDNGQYTLRSSQFVKNQERLFESLRSVHQVLKKRINQRPYLVQQAISLKKLEGRSLDFRLLCCRTVSGDWNVISAVARVSAEAKFVANLAQGGELYPLDKALELLFSKEESKQLKAYLYELSLECVRILSQENEGNFGEFGVDIGLDENGFPWIIEINTKPSKNFLPETDAKIRPSAKTIIQYGYYLSQFPFRRITGTVEDTSKKVDGKQ